MPRAPLVPLRVALAWRELQDLEVIAVRVAEVEGLDAAGVRVPVRQALRAARGVLDLEACAACAYASSMSLTMMRDVLKPSIVAARVDGVRPAARREELHQLDVLVAELQAHDAQAHAEYAEQVLVRRRLRLRVRLTFSKVSTRV